MLSSIAGQFTSQKHHPVRFTLFEASCRCTITVCVCVFRYQTLYQVGVFVSRSSLCCVKIRKLWILALLQVRISREELSCAFFRRIRFSDSALTPWVLLPALTDVSLWSLASSGPGSVYDITHLSSADPECGAAAVRGGLPAPAQRLAGVCYHPVRGFARWSLVRQHLLLHQHWGQCRFPSAVFVCLFAVSPRP